MARHVSKSSESNLFIWRCYRCRLSPLVYHTFYQTLTGPCYVSPNTVNEIVFVGYDDDKEDLDLFTDNEYDECDEDGEKQVRDDATKP